MTVHRRPVLAAAGLGLLLGSPCARAWGSSVRGSGTPASERREVTGFAGIAVAGPFRVVLRPAGREGVEITADDNLLPFIETALRGSGGSTTLHIQPKSNARIEPRSPIVVSVDVVTIRSIALSSSGSVAADRLRTDRLDTSIGGAGDIRLGALECDALSLAIGGSGSLQADGRARSFAVKIGGSGQCDAGKLLCAEVSVSIAGSGGAVVHADDSLRVSIAGSGDVRYSGKATPSASIAGSGRLSRG